MQAPGLLILILALCCQAVFPAAPRGSPSVYALDLNGELSQAPHDGTAAYYSGLDRLAQQANTGEYEYFLPDRLGSVRQVAGAGGFPSFAQEFDPYGNNTGFAGRGSSHYGFAGEWIDSTGLQYLRARYYSPAQGRFISRDPFPGIISQPASLNPYAYALNNPVLYTDPSGEFVETIFDAAMLGYDLFTIIDKAGRGCSIGLADWGALGLDALSLAVPFLPALGLAARLGNRSSDLLHVIRKMDNVHTTGQLGEKLANITKNTKRIDSLTGKVTYRIPDQLIPERGLLSEVKNVSQLSYTNQLKDYVLYSKLHELTFELYIRKSTKLSRPLEHLIDEGIIVRKFLAD